MDNVHTLKRPDGHSKQAGLRKLRKYAQTRKDVAEVYQKVLDGKISVNKALVQTGLRKAPAKTIFIDVPEVMVEKLVENLDSEQLRRLGDLIFEHLKG